MSVLYKCERASIGYELPLSAAFLLLTEEKWNISYVFPLNGAQKASGYCCCYISIYFDSLVYWHVYI